MPDTLYHYTSQHGLVGIVSAGALWATDIRYLNDSSEFTYALELARSALESWKHADLAYYPVFRALTTNQLTTAGSPILVASLSEEGDLLSQWRGYCSPGPGFAIGFNAAFFQSLTKSAGMGFYRCVYQAVDQLELIDELIRTSFDTFPRNVVPPASVTQYADAQAYVDAVHAALSNDPHARVCEKSARSFVSGLLDLAAVFKNPTFSEEKEWRIVTAQTRGRALLHRPGKSFLVPYTAIPIPFKTHRAIDEVVVGPCPHPDLAIASLEAYLASELGYLPRVTLSSVPFRFW